MREEWRFASFDKAPVQIIDGDRGKNYPKQNELNASGYCLFLNTGNVTKSGFNFSSCQFITQYKDELLRKGKLAPNDVVMTTRGTIGNVGYFNQSVPYENIRINSGMVIFRPDIEMLNPAFLYHYLRSGFFYKQVNSLRSGAAQPQLPIRDIKSISVPLPPKDTQKTIAKVLNAYDDLIENNKRCIALLEESARQLYREWFVRFRFPGHEHVKIVDGVPEGWDTVTLGDIANTNLKSHKAQELPEKINYIDISSVTEGNISDKRATTANEAPGRARRIAQHGDVIWSNVRPNLKAYSLVLHPSAEDVFSTGFTVLTAKKVPYTFLYQYVTTPSFVSHLVNHATGAGYPAVRPPDFERAEVLLPPKALTEQFHDICSPNYELIYKLKAQSKQLASARDHLLPKLMSGELVV